MVICGVSEFVADLNFIFSRIISRKTRLAGTPYRSQKKGEMMIYPNLTGTGVLLCFALLWLLSQLVLVSAQPTHVDQANANNSKKFRNALFTPLRQVPGPLYAPWTNLVLKYHVLSGNRSQYIHSLYKTYGKFHIPYT